jgi:hypothetical protein
MLRVAGCQLNLKGVVSPGRCGSGVHAKALCNPAKRQLTTRTPVTYFSNPTGHLKPSRWGRCKPSRSRAAPHRQTWKELMMSQSTEGLEEAPKRAFKRRRVHGAVTIGIVTAMCAPAAHASARAPSAAATASTGTSSGGHGSIIGTGEVKFTLQLDASRSCPVHVRSRSVYVYFHYANSTSGAYEPELTYPPGPSSTAKTGAAFTFSQPGAPPPKWYWWAATGTGGSLVITSKGTASFTNLKMEPASGNPGSARSTEYISGSWSCS